MVKKRKYYVVWQGKKPGIYASWDDCKKQVHGFDGAQYKSFASLDDAQLAYSKSFWEIAQLKGKKNLLELKTKEKPVLPSISVDAACAGNPGTLEFQGVYTETRTPLFKRGPYKMGTVNIGEFLAIVLGLAWLKKHNLDYPIYTDSRTAIAWIKKKNVNTKLEWTDENKDLLQAVHGALKWLGENTYNNKILKWPTREWGEIPADYGRK
ncbi:MAG: ribonuclease H [Chlorobi bacterium]|nr:ribonuclease H [Chlorobiota bacterium]